MFTGPYEVIPGLRVNCTRVAQSRLKSFGRLEVLGLRQGVIGLRRTLGLGFRGL